MVWWKLWGDAIRETSRTLKADYSYSGDFSSKFVVHPYVGFYKFHVSSAMCFADLPNRMIDMLLNDGHHIVQGA